MTTNADLDPAMLKKITQQARDQNFACFKDYLASKQDKDLGEMLNCSLSCSLTMQKK